jgi:hypothetical protein
MWFQFEPLPGNFRRFKKIFHYIGQSNNLDQFYLVRNAEFEPSQNPDFDYINDCLSQIEIAFKLGKPAIIGTHRLNFIGFINPENSRRNLSLFKELLNKIVKRWPDVEFMTSDQLGDLIAESKH